MSVVVVDNNNDDDNDDDDIRPCVTLLSCGSFNPVHR